jgi:hypothetical protein
MQRVEGLVKRTIVILVARKRSLQRLLCRGEKEELTVVTTVAGEEME